MNRRTEDRLRAALQAKASQVTPAELRPGQPPQDGDVPAGESRRRLTHHQRLAAPLLAAATVVAVVAGGAAIANISTSHRANPADSTTPAPTPTDSATNSPTATATRHQTHPAPNKTRARSSTSVASSTTAVSTPPPPLTLILSGVSVTLPPGWTQIAAPPSLTGATNTLCATSDGTRCDLYIARGDDDASAMYIDSPVVGGPCGANSLTDYSRRTIDGQVAEFRRFHASCVGPAGEQWFVPTDPQIVFWHPLGANDAVVEQAVAAASLPAVLGHTPARDRGYIQSITQRSDGYHVTFRRAVELPSGPIPEPGAASVHSFVVPIKNNFQSTCSEWKIPGYVRGQVCNMSLWVTQSAKGAHPTDGTLPFSSVEVVLWSDSRSVAVLQTRDTFPGGV